MIAPNRGLGIKLKLGGGGRQRGDDFRIHDIQTIN